MFDFNFFLRGHFNFVRFRARFKMATWTVKDFAGVVYNQLSSHASFVEGYMDLPKKDVSLVVLID